MVFVLWPKRSFCLNFKKLCEGLLKLFKLKKTLHLGLTNKIYTNSKISAETENTWLILKMLL